MPPQFEHLQPGDSQVIADRLLAAGVPTNQWADVVPHVAQELNFVNFKRQASTNPMAVALRAAVNTTPRLGADIARGFQTVTPDYIDVMLDKAIGHFESKSDPAALAQIDEFSRQKEQSAQKWAALIGSQVPLFAGTKISQVIGGAIGAKRGGMAGPAAAVTGGKIGSVLAPFAMMTAIETGGFVQAAEQLDLDKDIVEKWAKTYGPISGVIEYLQNVMLLKPWKSGAAPRATITAGVVKPFLKAMNKELASAFIEGMEELGQAAVFNSLMSQAVAEQNQRNRRAGRPDIEPALLEGMRQDFAQSFEAGFGVSLAFRTPSYGVHGVRRAMGSARTRLEANVTKMGAETTAKIEEGARPEDIVGREASGPLSVDNAGTAVARKEGREPISPENLDSALESHATAEGDVSQSTVVGQLERPGRAPKPLVERSYTLRQIAKAWGIAVSKLPKEMQTRDNLIQLLKTKGRGIVEGVQEVISPVASAPKGGIHFGSEVVFDKKQNRFVVKRKWHKGGRALPMTGVVFVPVRVHKAQAAEINRGDTADRKLRKAAQEMDTALLVFMNRVYDSITTTGRISRKLRKQAKDRFGVGGVELNEYAAMLEQDPESATLALTPETQEQLKTTLLQRRTAVNQARRRALRSIIGDKATDLLLPEGGTDLLRTLPLQDVLRRDQYNQYVDNLEGVVRTMIRHRDGLNGLRAAEQLEVDLAEASSVAPITLYDGTVLDQTQVAEEAHLPWWTRFTGLLPSLEQVADKTGLPLLRLDFALFDRHKFEVKLLASLKAAERYAWKDLPTALRKGLPSKMMFDYVSWLMQDGDKAQQAALVSSINADYKQEGFEAYHIQQGDDPSTGSTQVGRKTATNRSFLDNLARASGMENTKEIERLAHQLKDRYRTLYNWFAQNGSIHPDKFRTAYIPVIRQYIKDKKEGDVVTIDEWIRENRNNARHKELLSSLAPEDVDNIMQLGDTMRYMESRYGMPMPGQATPFSEYARTADAAFMEDMGRITDIRELTDLYIRRNIRRMVFGDVVPAVRSIIQQGNRILSGADKARFNGLMSNYFESIMGVPDVASRAMSKMKVFPKPISDQLINRTNRAFKWYRESPLFQHLPEWAKPSLLEPGSATFNMSTKDMLDLSMTYMYATTLGLPFNFFSPIKNMTQTSLIVPIVGLPTWLAGMGSLFADTLTSRNMIQKLHDFGLRPEHTEAFAELPNFTNLGRRFALSAKFMMSAYIFSDVTNVYAAGASALTAWKRLEADFEQSHTLAHLTDQEIIAKIFGPGFRGKGAAELKKLTSAKGLTEVMSQTAKGTQIWKGKKVYSSSAAVEIVEMIRSGKAADAEKFWTQFLVNSTQWRYGAGGSVQLMRNSVARAALMYFTWPVNYGSWVARAFRGGMGFRYAQSAAVQVAMMGILSSGGLNAWRWLLTGPLPDELVPLGPLAQLAGTILKILGSAGEIGTIEMLDILGFDLPEEGGKAARTKLKRSIQDLADDGLVDQRALDYL